MVRRDNRVVEKITIIFPVKQKFDRLTNIKIVLTVPATFFLIARAAKLSPPFRLKNSV